MAKIVNLSPQERAVREQQAARKLSARKAPFSQEAIYQEAYGEPNVLFESDYVKPEQKKKLQEYAKGVYDAFGNIRKGVFVTPEEERYQRQLEGIIGEEYDPLTRQKLISGIKGYRDTSLNAESGRRFGQYQTERAQTMGAVAGGQQQLNSVYEQMVKREEEDRKFQEQLALASARKSSRGPKTTKPSPGKVTFDEYLQAVGSDPNLLSSVIDVPAGLQERGQDAISAYIAAQTDLLLNKAATGDPAAALQIEAAYNDFIKYRPSAFNSADEEEDDFDVSGF